MKGKVASIILAIIGVVFSFIGYAGYKSVISIGETKVTNGEIIEVKVVHNSDDEDTKKAIIKYEVDGKYYKGETKISSDTYKMGQNVKVHYSVDTPNKFYIDLDVVFFAIFGGVGILCLLICIIIIIVGIVNKNSNKRLLNTVTPFSAKITNVDIDYTVTVMNKHPYTLICEYNGKTYIKKGIFKDILTPFNDGVLTHIDLYVDEKNENKYYIDTDSIDV